MTEDSTDNHAASLAASSAGVQNDSPEAGGELERISAKEAGAHFEMVKHEEGLQHPLFAAGELIAPQGLTKFRKGIAILHSMPATRDKTHTLTSHRLMDAIVALVQMDFKRRSPQQITMMREAEASPLFRTTKLELRRLVRIPDGSKHLVEGALDLLHNMPIRWNILGEDTNIEWEMKSHFLATYGLGKGRYRDHVCFSIDPRLLNLILEPKLWVNVHTAVQERLDTETSYTLYQQTWRYIGTTHKVTADFPLATWIDLISGPTRFVQIDGHGEKYVVDYPEWKRRHLMPAIKKINEINQLAHTLELIEIKSSRKVARLQFRFVPKQQYVLELPLAWDDSVIRILKDLGFAEPEIAELGQGFSQNEVVETFYRYQDAKRKLEIKGTPVHSPKALFNAILTNVSQEGALSDTQIEQAAKRAREEEGARRAKAQEEQAKREFSKWQISRLKEALLDWPAERRDALFQEFERSEGPAFKTLAKKGDQPVMDSQSLLSLLVNWLQQHQPNDWNELMPNPEDQRLSAWLMYVATNNRTVDG